MEFPKYIQLDFLFVVLGVLMVGFMNYLLFFRTIPLDLNNVLYFLLIMGVGIYFPVFGIYEMMKNYKRENEVAELQARKQKLELIKSIQQLETGPKRK